MNNIAKLIISILCASSVLVGCIDETFPNSTATGDQLGSSPAAIEALLWAMPAFANNLNTLGGGEHYDWGYGSVMHVRDIMTEEMVIASSGYDHYSNFGNNTYMGERYARSQFFWTYYWKFVQTANNLIKTIDPESANSKLINYLGVAHAFRSFLYLDMAQMFEFLENDGTKSVNAAGKDVLHLTIPIVTETITEKEARNNPRVSRQEIYKFILADLELAEQYMEGYNRPSKTLPNLSVIYGLRARLHMWVGEYAEAKAYARKAIATGGNTPTTKEQWLSTTNGFNDISVSSWMWGSSMQAEDNVVKTGIVNWTSWSSNETDYGYAPGGPYLMVDARFYSRIANDDFRKLSWKAPQGGTLDGKNSYVDNAHGAKLPEYASLKFRPGAGNMKDPKVASATDYPFMRVEEMYFIEAEAAAHLNVAEGVSLLENFMKTYRYKSYVCRATAKEDVIKEIFFQKRVELWGEGINFFDYKRLNMPITRGYEGTNHSDLNRFNTTTRPAFMNFCIVRSEKNNNLALIGYENPDPSDCYIPWIEDKQ